MQLFYKISRCVLRVTFDLNKKSRQRQTIQNPKQDHKTFKGMRRNHRSQPLETLGRGRGCVQLNVDEGMPHA